MAINYEFVADAVDAEFVKEENVGEKISPELDTKTKRELSERATARFMAVDLLVRSLPCMHCESGCVSPAVCAYGARTHPERLTYNRLGGNMQHPVSQKVAQALVTVGGVN